MLVKRPASQSPLRSAASDPCGFCSSTRRGGGFYNLGVVFEKKKKSLSWSEQSVLFVGSFTVTSTCILLPEDAIKLSSGWGWLESSHSGLGWFRAKIKQRVCLPGPTAQSAGVSTGKSVSLFCHKALKSSFSLADFVEMCSSRVEANWQNDFALIFDHEFLIFYS